MGKYNINYACGHGSFEKQLFGKMDTRDNYVAWAEGNMVCPDCYKAKTRATEKATPLKAEIIVSMYGWIAGGAVVAITQGDSYSIKEQLKTAGFRWEDYSPATDILGMNKPKKAWMIRLLEQAEMGKISADELGKKIQAIQDKIIPRGIVSIGMDTSCMASITYAVTGRMAAQEVTHA